MNVSRQQQHRALIENLSGAPNHLDELAREKRLASDKAANDLCHTAELILRR